jgi:hypothetical protein
MATDVPFVPADLRPDEIARARARLESGELPDADELALAILVWTCPPFALAS